MKQTKKYYVRPLLTIVGIQVENQLLAGSKTFPDDYNMVLSSEEGSGEDALSKEYDGYDLWD